MNRRNEWQKSLARANEDLAKHNYSIVISEPEDEGFYRCDIYKEGVKVETYADNYYEDELDSLVADAWDYTRVLAKANKGTKKKSRENTIQVLDDLNEYASRYGLDALGYAIREMARANEIHITQKQMCSLWEYGGNKGE